MYSAELEIKDTTERITSASYLYLLLSIGMDGQLHTSIYDKRDDFNFHITNFRSWVVIFHLRQSMAFLYLNFYIKPGLAPRMNILFWGSGDFPVSYFNRDTSWNAWNRHSGSFMVDTGILFSNMKSPSQKYYMTFWPLTNSDFTTDKTFHQFDDLDTELDLYPIMSGFHAAFATSVACQQGMLNPSGHLVSSPFFRLACAPVVETRFRELAMSLLDFSPCIPLGTFSISLSMDLLFREHLNLLC